MPARAHRILIPLAALLAILPLLLAGASCGHDFDFHILSWLEAASQFAHLHYPHWAYTPAWNAGEPRFIFYPPLSWALGATLGLILPWTLVPAAFTFLCLTLSGFTAHRLASRYAGAQAATLAAVLYLANPYMLFTAYERTAYGELLAAAWLPLLLIAALAPRIRIASLAFPIALLWLSNAPAGVMSCYALAFLALVRLAIPAGGNRVQIARATAAATMLGLMLAAFYLVPAVLEQRYIQSGMATIEGMRIADNTLFHHMAPATDDTLAHDAVLQTASTISLLLLGTIAAAFLAAGRPKLLLPLLGLALLIAFLLTPPSLPLWTHLPELRFLQFPWRLTAILGATLSLVAAIALDRLKLRPVTAAAASLALAAALILPAWHLFAQPCESADTVQARVALFHSSLGTEPTDEYTPADADNDVLAHANPPYWIAQANDAPAPLGQMPGALPDHFAVELPQDAYLILNRRSFRDWEVRVDGQHVGQADPVRDDGLISVRLPPGKHHIDLTFGRPGGFDLEALGIVCSVAGLGLLGASPRGNAQRTRRIRKER